VEVGVFVWGHLCAGGAGAYSLLAPAPLTYILDPAYSLLILFVCVCVGVMRVRVAMYDRLNRQKWRWGERWKEDRRASRANE
jgi:hypothetical protein